MQCKCETCNDTGSRDKAGTFLDCCDCNSAVTRLDLMTFVRSLESKHPEDIAFAIHQRALAMAPKSEAPQADGWIATIANGPDKPVFTRSRFMTQKRDAEVCAEQWRKQWPHWYIAVVGYSAAPAAANGAMPELPKPETMIVESDLGHRAYSADQMRAYGKACALAAAGPNAALVEVIHKAQSILAHHLPTDGPDAKTTISTLLGLLDGPESRSALSGAKGN